MTEQEIARDLRHALSEAARSFAEAVDVGNHGTADVWATIAFGLGELLLPTTPSKGDPR
jgi:hypothetical protein